MALGEKGSIVRSNGTVPEYAAQYAEITGTSATLQYNKMHGANNVGLVTLTLPSSAAVGERFSVIGVGACGWIIAQNAGQSIQKEATVTTVGVGGSVAGAQGTSVEIVCIEADTKWMVSYSSGTLTYV